MRLPASAAKGLSKGGQFTVSASDPTDQRPLSGYRILDLSMIMAGPICTMLLADMGADVIKVEPPGGGDLSRSLGTVYLGGVSTQYLASNRGKRSITLDLREDAGREVFYRLVPRADVIVENFRPGVVARLGVDYETLRNYRADIIYCSISAFGQTGPYSDRPANDPIVQAISGLMALTGERGGPPLRVGNPAPDFGGASLACYAICAALYHRERTGKGQKIELSLLDAMIYSLIPREGEVLATGKEHERYGTGHPTFVPYQAFEARDQRWVFLSCFTEKFWRNLCQVLGRPDLAEDPRFLTNPDRVKHRDELVSILEEIFKARPAAEWVERLNAGEVPCGPVNDLGQAMEDPQVIHNQMAVELEHPRAGKFKSLAHPVKFLRTPPRYGVPPPELGQQTEEILREVGYTEAQIQALRAQEVI